ncbi:UNVERIFIED_ORG: hypothetical protein J2W65_002140 [Pseudomonas parafulva]|nr:hypothetical protein [Pseudomonas parafulva]RDL22448.1 hypothetical protein F633_01302 [Pseudomonas sp. LAMO17WK12:I3]RED13697.1 hypothetical protein D884_00929 [Pseudomonas sp. URMO17WK12:I10]TCT94171.1 hypothetical protein EC913_113101 [Pseudomonas sp. LP_4_YM]TFA89164.1 hypothetical protein F473_02284 [Pseudomonas sp. URIL14HWK12:I1]SNB73318.1 hypothetical protein SAMN02746026_02329 [Pseudomonas sp. LAIL14HWK12:I4]SOD06026.1 hypothetical protein SAMN05660967_00569 [Pseudomonas sp. URMO1
MAARWPMPLQGVALSRSEAVIGYDLRCSDLGISAAKLILVSPHPIAAQASPLNAR